MADESFSCFELDTDRRPEAIRVQRVRDLPGVEFWSITQTTRAWAMVHDAFGACFVQGREGVPLGRWSSRGRERTVLGGSVHLFEPDECHRGATLRQPTTLSIIWWSESVIAQAAAESGLRGRIRWRVPELPPSARPASLGLLWEMLDAEDPSMADVCADVTAELLRGAGEGVTTARRFGPCHPGVQRALLYLAEHFAEPVSLDELASAARLSKYHFARCFREATGFAPHRYQMLLRTREARRSLERGACVDEAADRAGFADASHLTRVFRGWLGVAPGAWSRAFRAADLEAGAPRRTLPPPACASGADRESA